MTRFRIIAVILCGLILIGIFTAYGGLRQVEEGAVSEPNGTSVISEVEVGNLVEDLPENHSVRWFNSSTTCGLKGVALVIHGLNMRPERMQPIIDRLTQNGIDALSLSLRGHGGNYARRDDMDVAAARLESFKSVSYFLWTNEAYLAFKKAQKGLKNTGSPYFLPPFPSGA